MPFSILFYRWENWGRDQAVSPWRQCCGTPGQWPQIQRAEGQGWGARRRGQPPPRDSQSQPGWGCTCPLWGRSQSPCWSATAANVQTLQSNLKMKKKSVCPKLHSSTHPAECVHLCGQRTCAGVFWAEALIQPQTGNDPCPQTVKGAVGVDGASGVRMVSGYVGERLYACRCWDSQQRRQEGCTTF